MNTVHRYDFAPIIRSETTDEGYLRVWARTARTGTQLYRRADGSQVREYRPPEEVSDPASLATFGMKPVTWGHPPVLLDSKNTKQFQTGHSGSQVRFHDGFVEVALAVTDADSITRIKRGDATEVSTGYKVDFDPTPGITPEGESYDGVQRNIRVNHIAIVPRGRAGPQVRLLLDHMDAADAVAIDPQLVFPDPAPTSSFPSSPTMATVKLDGLEIDLPAEVAGAVQSQFRDMERQLTAATASATELTSKLDEALKEVDALAAEKEAAQGRADALEERVTELESGTSPDRLDIAQVDELLKARLDTLQHLAPAFPDDYKFDGIDEESLYATAYENLTGVAPDENLEFPYIQGVVDGLLTHLDAAGEEDGGEEEGEEDSTEEDNEDRDDHAENLRLKLSRTQGSSSRGDAAATNRQNLENAWKKPLTANK